MAGLALRLVAAAAVGACGSNANGSPRSAGSGPRDGGSLSIAWKANITSLDPTQSYDAESWAAERLVFEPLLTYDRSTNLVPLLAASMPEISADGRTYTVRVRDGVEFVDRRGNVVRALTATDVQASFDRLLSPHLKPRAPNASLYADISGAQDVIDGRASGAAGIAVADPRTVRFTLIRPDATFLNLLALPLASIVPGDRAGTDTAAFAADPIGTGPYLLQSNAVGQEAAFVRNPHYWRADRKGPDEIHFRVGVDGTAALQQVEAGTLDLMGDQLPSASFTSVAGDPRFRGRVFHRPLIETEFVFFDTQAQAGSPLSHVEVRQALEYAIDKRRILTLTHGAGVVADCIFPPDLPAYEPTCSPYRYDPPTARRLLGAAGFPDGFSTDFYTDDGDPDPAIAVLIKQDLAEVGVRLHVITQPGDVLNTSISRHSVAMGFAGWLEDYPDPSDFVDPILSCATAVQGQASNPSYYCNPEVDNLARLARGEVDRAKRLALYRTIQRDIMSDAPLVPLRHAEHYTLVGEHVRGFDIHPVWLYDLASLWLAP